MAGYRLAEIFDLEGAFQPGREESAKGSDEGGESGEYEDVELHGCDVDDLRQEPQVGEVVRMRDKYWVRGAGEARENIGAKILRERRVSLDL
jgi:hypothetical protein